MGVVLGRRAPGAASTPATQGGSVRLRPSSAEWGFPGFPDARSGEATRANLPPWSGWFCPRLGFGFGAFRAPSAHLRRAFRRKTSGKAQPAVSCRPLALGPAARTVPPARLPRGFRAPSAGKRPGRLGRPASVPSLWLAAANWSRWGGSAGAPACASCVGAGPAARSPRARRTTRNAQRTPTTPGSRRANGGGNLWPARPKRPLGLREVSEATCSTPGQRFRGEKRQGASVPAPDSEQRALVPSLLRRGN